MKKVLSITHVCNEHGEHVKRLTLACGHTVDRQLSGKDWLRYFEQIPLQTQKQAKCLWCDK